MIEDIQFDLTRIDLYGDLGFRAEMEMAAQQIHQATDLRLIEISWRAAPQCSCFTGEWQTAARGG